MICCEHCFKYLGTNRIIIDHCSKKNILDIEKYLNSCIEILGNDDQFKTIIKSLQDLMIDMDQFKCADDSGSEVEENQALSTELMDQVAFIKQRKTNVSRKTALDCMLDTVYESEEQKLVKRIILSLRDLFEKYLAHYSGVLWNEIIYFSNNGRMQKAFNPSTRLAIHSAITNPGYFLDTSEEFDITVLHRLYLECGRLINMYDWFIAFKSMIDPDCKLSDKEAQ